MAGVTSRGLAQAVSVSLAVVNDSISPAPQILVQGTPGPPSLGPYNDDARGRARAAVSRAVSRPLVLEPRRRRSRSTRCCPSAPSCSFAPESSTVSATFRQQIVSSSRCTAGSGSISPTRSVNDVLFTRQPTFAWSSPPVTLPPGPWTYEITITNTANGQTKTVHASTTRAFVPPTPLEACTSYRWSVHAKHGERPPASDQITANSPGTFVIQTVGMPDGDALLSEFSKPVRPRPPAEHLLLVRSRASRRTCRSTIYDLRGRHVRTIVPGPLPAQLDSGAYGRQSGTEGRMRYPAASGTDATTPAATCRRACTSPSSSPTGSARPSRSCTGVR